MLYICDLYGLASPSNPYQSQAHNIIIYSCAGLCIIIIMCAIAKHLYCVVKSCHIIFIYYSDEQSNNNYSTHKFKTWKLKLP